MAFSLLSLLLLRSPSLTRKTRGFCLLHRVNSKAFSTSESSLLQSDADHSKLSDPKSSLSARMSFVFDQIDAIEKEKTDKDEAVQRIRAWREAKKKKNDGEHAGLGFAKNVESNSGPDSEVEVKKKENLFTEGVELVHPWPEWIELMERLVQQNYFDHRRKDEDRMLKDLPVEISELSEEVFDFTRDWNTVRTACLNFGRDRFDILRSLSRQDIQILVGHGCPSVDKKVVFSAKLLRKHAHLDEGDVCSSCSLRSSCERAYLLTPKEDEARTFDLMRVLLTFGFDPINRSVENKSLLKIKSLRTVVRKLLHEVVKLSAVPIDPNLPPPVIKKPPPKVKQPPPPPKKRVGRDDIEMKKGDWLCPKCDFMNFAKNTVCLRCDAKRPKRQLLPGEWECPECNFLNYRRNMACFHCEHKRPRDEYMENQLQERPRDRRAGVERVTNRPEVYNAWNFDFDDDESDGADVAAFEFADPPRMGENFDDSLHNQTHGETLRGFEDGYTDDIRIPEAQERGGNSDHTGITSRNSDHTGFDDFDDEEDDDINSYELATPRNSSKHETSSKNLSRIECFDSEDFHDSKDHSLANRGTDSVSYNKRSRPKQAEAAFSGSEDDNFDFDSDEERSVYPNWKSSHVARQRTSGRGRIGPSRNSNSGSDDELGLGSRYNNDLREDFGSRWNMGQRLTSSRRDLRKAASSDSDDDDLQTRRNKVRGNTMSYVRRGSMPRDRAPFKSARDSRLRSGGAMDGRGYSFDNTDLNRSFRGSHGNNRRFQGDDRGERRLNDRRGNLLNFSGPEGGERSCNQQRGRFNKFDNQSDTRKPVDNRLRRRIIER